MKKLIALLLALVMMFALCACTLTGKEKTSQGSAANSIPFTKDDVIRIVFREHASWPYNEDWKVWEYIREGVGATLDITAIPAADISTKLPLIFEDKAAIPDVFQLYGKQTKYVRSGAMIPYEDVEQYMPNAKAFYESLPEEEYRNLVTYNRHADGKLYWFVHYGREQSSDVQAWLYRKDIFEKHNLKVPETFDELYEVCKELKKLYPDSYPYCMREGNNRFTTIGNSFQKYWRDGVYYNHDTETWHQGEIEDAMLEAITFHKKMIDEGLLMPNFMNIPTNDWQELVSADRGFIMPDYQTRIDFFNSLCRPENPDFTLAAMKPPVANPEKGAPLIAKTNIERSGIWLPNSGDEKRIANAAKYLDWFYTDEAIELVSWGKEGETFEVVDGKKQYIRDDAGTQIQTLYGFNSGASFAVLDSEALLSAESEDIAATRELALSSINPFPNPTTQLTLTNEESKRVSELNSGLGSYGDEMIKKFLGGEEPLSKWDEYVETYKSLIDVEEFLSIYAGAYERIAQ